MKIIDENIQQVILDFGARNNFRKIENFSKKK